MEGLLETKGGSIQSILLHDLTGFGALDLAVGDCDGIVTLFSRQQILSKRDLGSAITELNIHSDLAGGCEIIAGDINGSLTSFLQHDALWKINISEESAKLATLGVVSARWGGVHYLGRLIIDPTCNVDWTQITFNSMYAFNCTER